MKTKTVAVALTCVTFFSALKTQAQEPLSKVQEFGLGFSNFNSFSMQYRWGNEHRLYRISGTVGNSSSFGKTANDQSFAAGNVVDNLSTDAAKRTTPVNIGVGLNFSILKLRPATEKFGFLCGGTYGVSYSALQDKLTSTRSINVSNSSGGYTPLNSSRSQTSDNQTLRVSAGIALGGYYKITPAFWLYAEIDPGIYYAFSTVKNTTEYKQEKNTQINYPSSTQQSSASSHTHEFGISGLSNSFASLTLVYHLKK